MFRSNYRANVQSIYGAADIEAYFLRSNSCAKSRCEFFFGAVIRTFTVIYHTQNITAMANSVSKNLKLQMRRDTPMLERAARAKVVEEASSTDVANQQTPPTGGVLRFYDTWSLSDRGFISNTQGRKILPRFFYGSHIGHSVS